MRSLFDGRDSIALSRLCIGLIRKSSELLNEKYTTFLRTFNRKETNQDVYNTKVVVINISFAE